MLKRLMFLKIILLFVGLGLVCWALLWVDAGIQAIALRPVAARLGTKPSQVAITDYVTAALESHKGLSQAEVHQLLDGIGEFHYSEMIRIKIGDGRLAEDASWTIATLPTLVIGADWSLRYNINGRLVDASAPD
jgi:hypothetical protein